MFGRNDFDPKAMAVAILAVPVLVGAALIFAAGFGLGAWLF
ncbi:MAG: hypothetical protein AAF709_21575 [Pseudomonadota bacterium]